MHLSVKKISLLAKRLSLSFRDVYDHREFRNKTQPTLPALLRFMVLAIATNKRKLRQMEFFYELLSPKTKRVLGFHINKKQLSDTALYECLVDSKARFKDIPYMIEQKSGNIVSLGSDAGRVGNSGEVLYCGTKAAIMASVKALVPQ